MRGTAWWAAGWLLCWAVWPCQGQTVTPPTLQIEQSAPQAVVLAWPASATGFVLEATSDIGGILPWAIVTTSPVQQGDLLTVSEPTTQQTRYYRLRYVGSALPLTTVVGSSPMPAEDGVAVTRETVLYFSAPLAGDTLLATNQFHAEFGGRMILSRIEVSSDHRKASLFYLENLPAGARVQVTFDGNAVKDQYGSVLDADGDGVAGGVFKMFFDTFSTVAVGQTAVIGHVYASQLVPDPNGTGQTANQPLEGVTITVDGAEETLRTTTDAAGFFKLQPAPAGRFFVHVDGRTAVGSQWPTGQYYPFVGKAWDAVAGVETNLASGTGEIYLPLIAADTLKPVSATTTTEITFPPSVIASNAVLNGVTISVPPNDLFDNSGQRGGRVGIAPVSPDRLPEPLPPGLSLPLVITIQTDGPLNFDQPVPVRFPNLPDPATGLKLPPGAKSALWSFNHKSGKWEIQGPMTVTADGAYVVSDPGVGVRQPGWHGSAPGTPPGGPPPSGPCSSSEGAGCGLSLLTGALDCGLSFVPGVGTAFCLGMGLGYGGARNVMDCAIGDGVDCAVSVGANAAGIAACLAQAAPGVGQAIACGAAGFSIGKSCAPCIFGLFGGVSANALSLDFTYERDVPYGGPWASARRIGLQGRPVLQDDPTLSPEQVDFQAHLALLEAYTNVLQVMYGASIWYNAVDLQNGDYRPASQQVVNLLTALHTAAGTGSPGGIAVTDPEVTSLLSLPRPASISETDVRDVAHYFNQTFTEYQAKVFTHAQAGRIDFMDRDELIAAMKRWTNALGTLQGLGYDAVDLGGAFRRFYEYNIESYSDTTPGKLDSRQVWYWLRNETTGQVLRGKLNGEGHFPIAALTPDTLYRARYYEAQRGLFGEVSFESATSGLVTEVPRPMLLPLDPGSPDTDGDGLPDAAEEVIGTSPTLWSTPNNGISDGSAVKQGLDPFGGAVGVTGVVASGATPGRAVDVSILNDVAAVADMEGGVTLFNVASGLNPVNVAQLPTPANAYGVACSGSFAAVADDTAGLLVLDISQPSTAFIKQVVPLGAAARAVAAGSGMAYVGLTSGEVVVVEMSTGTVLDRLSLGGGAIEDVALQGDYLYALSVGTFYVLSVEDGTLTKVTSLASPGSKGAGNLRLRLFVGGNRAYASQLSGFNIFDLTAPDAPTLVRSYNDSQRGWRHLVSNGSGIGLAAVGPNSTDDGPHNLSLYNLNPDGTNSVFLVTFPLPGGAQAVAVNNGLGYVACSQAGLQVVGYLPYDTQGQAPGITLSLDLPLQPNSDHYRSEEGKAFQVSAGVSDDVQVRDVEFYLDDVKVVTDGSFAFAQTLTAPLLAAGKTTFKVQARAVDTGGNATWSAARLVDLVKDATPPRLIKKLPKAGGIVGAANLVAAYFNEPIDPNTVSDLTFRLRFAGADGTFGTADDVAVANGQLEYRSEIDAILLSFGSNLDPGLYEVSVRPPVADLAGNAIPAEVKWQFWVLGGVDSDQDGIPDAIEIVLGLDPNQPSTFHDGILDGDRDLDGDGLPTSWELRYGYNPKQKDSDSNGINDGDEDPDNDGLKNLDEFKHGTNPLVADTDGDGWDDLGETLEGSDPVDANSKPKVRVVSMEASFLNAVPETLPAGSTLDAASPVVSFLNSLPDTPPADLSRTAVSAAVSYLNAQPQSPDPGTSVTVLSPGVSYLNSLPATATGLISVPSALVSYQNQ